MTTQEADLLGGRILFEAIIGAMRASGTTFSRWCRDEGVAESTAKAVAYGQMSGPKGLRLLRRMIEAAGRDNVLRSYRYRMLREADRLRSDLQAAA